MLKGIPEILSPALLKVLCEMGHSDRLVIADGNFPAETMGKNSIVIRMDGHGVPEILDAILQVMPLDTYVEKPVNLMQLMPNDVGKIATPIWDTYKEIVAKYDERGAEAVSNIDRFEISDLHEELVMCRTSKSRIPEIERLFKKEWHTEEKLISNEKGESVFNGFYGEYSVVIEKDGTQKEYALHLEKGKENTLRIVL
jgi:L-fucose mutarotase